MPATPEERSVSIIDDLYSAVAHAVVGIHAGLQPVFGETNGYGWALSIVLLTAGVRLVLFPLFVKQIKSQRTLQMIQPKMKEIREKHKNDKQKMNEELMKLQREHGNPLLGCLPIFAQIPLFIALFRVLRSFRPTMPAGRPLGFYPDHGLTQHQVETIGNARIFGVPLSVAFNSPSAILKFFTPPVSDAPVRVVTLILVVIMCTTTFLTQKQIMGRNGPVDPSQRTQQRVFLYLAPISLGVSGIFFGFPVGVLLYWMTTNLWSMGQQFFVLRKMPPVVPGQPVAARPGASGASGPARPSLRKGKVEEPPPPPPAVRRRQERRPGPHHGDGEPPALAAAGAEAPDDGTPREDAPPPPRAAKPSPPAARRAPPSRARQRRGASKGKRRGGRR